MKFGFEFWGLGIGLGGFGEVEARENAKEKPRILGCEGVPRHGFCVPRRGVPDCWVPRHKVNFRMSLLAILGLCSGGSGDVSGVLF